jgi:hypothetical protein
MAPISGDDPRGGERGAALLEFALTLPLLLVVIAGIVDFGFAFQRYEVLTNAAREGARMGALPVGYTDDEIRRRVKDYIKVGLAYPNDAAVDAVMPDSNIVIPNPDPPLIVGGVTVGRLKHVEVSYQYNWILLRPILGLINKNWNTGITLRATSQMRIEGSVGS